MAELYSSKSPRNLSKKVNENSEVKCKMKLDYPPVSHSGDFHMGLKSLASQTGKRNSQMDKLNNTKNRSSKANLKFQCHYEERKNRNEIRRRKIIQKLRKIYKIDVEGLNDNVTNEIIMKVETLEKEKKQREQRNAERTMIMISRLLEEQKYKTREHKLYHPPWRKTLRNSLIRRKLISQKEEKIGEEEDSKILDIVDEEQEIQISADKVRTSGEIKETEEEEEEVENLPECIHPIKEKESIETDLSKKFPERSKNLLCLPTEKSLESFPKEIVFKDYEKGKVYLQELKITNVGLETIHCRYLGIVVHTKIQEKFPIGVAVRDNVKLRPGLSCSTKIRLCSQDDTQELQSSIVYETRRQNKPMTHSWFFVKVFCIPVRAVVKISPLKLTFPTLTWCEATGPKNGQLLKKYLKIENSGAKACSCKISTEKLEEKFEDIEIYGEMGEGELSSVSTKVKSNTSKEITSLRGESTSSEFYGEGYSFPLEGIETSKALIEELLENVFAVFRFSEKYYIEIPGNATKQIEVRFIPHYKGFHHELYFLQFEDCYNCQEQAVEMTGDIKKMPLRVEPQVIDMRICVANSGVYANTFRIFNDSKMPYTVIVKVPSAIKNHAHVHPRSANILPCNFTEFSVRIYPRVSLARDAPRYFKNFQVLEFPLFIHGGNVGACNLDYMKIYVFALITDYCLQLSPSFINFGKVTTVETVRTQLELTNFSLALHEYGFLNLPKGVRIEPNMGFGQILPKESITLDLLYSPGEELKGRHEFQIEVTSLAKYGGFREKLETEQGSEETLEFLWGDDYEYTFPSPEVIPETDDLEFIQMKKEEEDGEEEEEEEVEEEEEDFEICDEESSIEGEELMTKILHQENIIREFLKQDRDKLSEYSIFKKMNLQSQDFRDAEATPNKVYSSEAVNKRKKYSSEYGEMGESETPRPCELRPDMHIVSCRACVVEPRCRISESVIQLPATPCSSFSLYRFRLNAMKDSGNVSCSCGFRKGTKKCGEAFNFVASFEFQHYCPHITLEPASGCIKAGDSIPITVIYRPEFPAEQLCQESRLKKANKMMSEKKSENSKSAADIKRDYFQSGQKLKVDTPRNSKVTADVINSSDIQEIINTSLYELEKYDLFAGERSLQELISPFYVEAKVQCVVKSGTDDEQLEILEMIIICPAIKPNFIYLGKSQEINFNKVFVGTKAQKLLQAQNISFERITPMTTILNPEGPFYCPAGLKAVLVDPEHIWGAPLIYAPLEAKGMEKQFFEIYCGPTNIFLTVRGEGVLPQYKITPNFGCCLMDAKPGSLEELKLEIENLSPIRLNLQIQKVFLKEGNYYEEEEDEETKSKKEKSSQREESKDKKKSKNSESDKNFRFFDTIPEVISSSLENFVDVETESRIFMLMGVDDNGEIGIPQFGRIQIRIQLLPPADKSDTKYAVKYAFMLERVSLLKEILVVGKIFKRK